MEDWCLQLDTTESIKQSFEYASLTRNTTLLKKLIDKHAEEKASIKEYVQVYGVLYGYMVNEIAGTDIEVRLDKIGNIQDPVLRVLVDIMKCYNYYFNKEFERMLTVSQGIESKILSISENRKSFIKNCYIHRVAELLCIACFQLNDLESTRHYANIIIHANICDKTVSDAYYGLGMSYLTMDRDMCLRLLQRSYDVAQESKIYELKRETKYNLKLAELYYEDRVLDATEIDRLKKAFYQEDDEDFLTYFRAVSSDDNNAIHKSLQQFFTQGNYFFSSVCARKLYNEGDRYPMLDWIMDYKKERRGRSFEEDCISNFCNDVPTVIGQYN